MITGSAWAGAGATLPWAEPAAESAPLEELPAGAPDLPATVTLSLGARGLAPRVMRGRALASVMRGLAAAWELSESDRVAFDPGLVSTVEPLAALTCGCAVIFAGNLDGAGLGSALASAGSTAAHLSEDSWTRLLDAGWNAPPGFRAIVAGAPAIQTVHGLLRAGARVLCVLVPTDGGAWYATAELRGPDAPLKAIPLPNLEIEVVDAAGAPALPGALCGCLEQQSRPGELLRRRHWRLLGQRNDHRTGAWQLLELLRRLPARRLDRLPED